MSALKETIKNFQEYVLEKSAFIQDHVTGPDLAFRQTRLDVYRAAYSLRLLEILGKAFPALCALAGEKQAESLGRAYIETYPSNHFSVRYFGRHFSRFLSSHIPAEPMFAEMATFEWALEDVIDAADAPQLTFEEMTKLNPDDWANLSLKLHPSINKVMFYYPIPSLWQHFQQEADQPDLTRKDAPQHWVVWRFNRQAFFRPLTEEQLFMLKLIEEGRTFSEICTELSASMNEDEVVNFAAQNLRQWIEEGIFSEFCVQ